MRFLLKKKRATKSSYVLYSASNLKVATVAFGFVTTRRKRGIGVPIKGDSGFSQIDRYQLTPKLSRNYWMKHQEKRGSVSW